MRGALKTPQFTALNPLQRVPVLVLDDGTAIAETMAICRYFEEIHPQPALFGADALGRGPLLRAGPLLRRQQRGPARGRTARLLADRDTADPGPRADRTHGRRTDRASDFDYCDVRRVCGGFCALRLGCGTAGSRLSRGWRNRWNATGLISRGSGIMRRVINPSGDRQARQRL